MFYLSVYEILYMYIIVSISNTIEKNDERLLPESIDSREKKKQKFISRNCTEKTNETGNEWKKKANSQSISGRCKERFGSDAIVNTGDYRSNFSENGRRRE